MGVLLLRPQDHAGLLSLAEGVALMRRGFEDFAASTVTLSNPRTRTNTPQGFRMNVHQGVSPSQRGACTSARGERVEILPGGRQKYVGRGQPVFVLFDPDTAALLLIMIGEPRARELAGVHALAGFQTACAAVVGTNLLARPDACRVGVLGSGGQARYHLAALAATRPIAEAVVYSPTAANREAFAREMQALLGIPVRTAADTRTVVQAAEILLVCTNANEPVLDGADLQPGTHVTSIVHSNKEMQRSGLIQRMRQEIDDETLRRAALVVTANKAQEELDQPEVLWGAAQRGVLRWDTVAEASDVINGRVSLSEVHASGGITFFKNPGAWGMGAGALLRGFYDRAREAGVGLELDDLSGLEPAY